MLNSDFVDTRPDWPNLNNLCPAHGLAHPCEDCALELVQQRRFTDVLIATCSRPGVIKGDLVTVSDGRVMRVRRVGYDFIHATELTRYERFVLGVVTKMHDAWGRLCTIFDGWVTK